MAAAAVALLLGKGKRTKVFFYHFFGFSGTECEKLLPKMDFSSRPEHTEDAIVKRRACTHKQIYGGILIK